MSNTVSQYSLTSGVPKNKFPRLEEDILPHCPTFCYEGITFHVLTIADYKNEPFRSTLYLEGSKASRWENYQQFKNKDYSAHIAIATHPSKKAEFLMVPFCFDFFTMEFKERLKRTSNNSYSSYVGKSNIEDHETLLEFYERRRGDLFDYDFIKHFLLSYGKHYQKLCGKNEEPDRAILPDTFSDIGTNPATADVAAKIEKDFHNNGYIFHVLRSNIGAVAEDRLFVTIRIGPENARSTRVTHIEIHQDGNYYPIDVTAPLAPRLKFVALEQHGVAPLDGYFGSARRKYAGKRGIALPPIVETCFETQKITRADREKIEAWYFDNKIGEYNPIPVYDGKAPKNGLFITKGPEEEFEADTRNIHYLASVFLGATLGKKTLSITGTDHLAYSFQDLTAKILYIYQGLWQGGRMGNIPNGAAYDLLPLIGKALDQKYHFTTNAIKRDFSSSNLFRHQIKVESVKRALPPISNNLSPLDLVNLIRWVKALLDGADLSEKERAISSNALPRLTDIYQSNSTEG